MNDNQFISNWKVRLKVTSKSLKVIVLLKVGVKTLLLLFWSILINRLRFPVVQVCKAEILVFSIMGPGVCAAFNTLYAS